ncbi:Inner membrane complex protein [Babesia duncani]|uniref:Inner membrane complex protein n=1 Tax=Babesia duncani TaxID=323732 RepID=A0AAD9UQ86_9APIC|nr:Inner membrane complex protein [Babesia duncani]
MPETVNETQVTHPLGEASELKASYALRDSKDLSFYECPTAAASISTVNGSNDAEGGEGISKYSSRSLDSEQEDNILDSQFNKTPYTNVQQQDPGTLIIQPQAISGGYFGGFEGTIFQGPGTETTPPKTILPPRNLVNMPNNTFLGLAHENNNGVIYREPANVQMPNTPSYQSNQYIPTEWLNDASVKSCYSIPSQMNVATPSSCTMDYSRAVETTKSETNFVQEGYDTIQIPKYRPVEYVDRTIQVPQIHHVDTYVPKTEIREIESIVKKPYTKQVDTIVETPEIHYTDRVVEVPEYHEVTKTIPKVEIQERTKYMPKIEVKIVPKYVDVPVIKYVDKYEEHEEIVEVIKHVEKREVVEVPREVVKHVIKPIRKVIEQERIVPVVENRNVPIEKIKFVPKIETVELIRQIPKIIDVPVPYNVPKIEYIDEPYLVPKYRDVPVAVPVMQKVKPVYHYNNEVQYIDVPVHRPYFVIHDHINFNPAGEPVEQVSRIVGVNKIDLSTLPEADRIQAQARLQERTRMFIHHPHR